MLLVGLGLKLKHVKGDEVNGKPKQEEEKEMGKGGGAWPGGVAEIGRAGTDLRRPVL